MGEHTADKDAGRDDPVRRCTRVFAHPGHVHRVGDSPRLYWCKGGAIETAEPVLPPGGGREQVARDA